MKKVKTGIKNFDRLLGGGIPKKEMVLIEGEPGSGKSNLGLEFLYRGAEKGEKGLYISFQETREEILRVNTFDWKFEEHVKNGNINVRKIDPYRHGELANMLRGTIRENNAERVVIDPITDLDLYIDSKKDIRKNLLSIKEELTELGVTGLIIAESEESTSIEEEIAGGIINMSVKRDKGKIKREIYIKKLRGSDYNNGVHNYIFKSEGLIIQ